VCVQQKLLSLLSIRRLWLHHPGNNHNHRLTVLWQEIRNKVNKKSLNGTMTGLSDEGEPGTITYMHSTKKYGVKMKITKIVLLAASLLITAPVMAGTIRVGFSPEGTAHQLVLGTIDSAKSSIRMMAYSFTDPSVMKALINAKKRGVDIKIVIDKDGNRNKSSLAAMNLVTGAGIQLRTDDDFKIQHDKVIIVDNKSVETGSYNYSQSAAKVNSENAILIQDAPDLAAQYLAHWQDRWQRGQDWIQAY
jgi:hypothetical protein